MAPIDIGSDREVLNVRHLACASTTIYYGRIPSRIGYCRFLVSYLFVSGVLPAEYSTIAIVLSLVVQEVSCLWEKCCV